MREGVEGGGREAQDGGGGFVAERAGWVPGLDLLSEEDTEFAEVGFSREGGEDAGAEGEEHFGGELGEG